MPHLIDDRNQMSPNLMSADQTQSQNSSPTAGPTHREEVEQMKSEKQMRRRAWDEMSATDRAVLLEAVRQRRLAAEQRRSTLAGLNSMRQLR